MVVVRPSENGLANRGDGSKISLQLFPSGASSARPAAGLYAPLAPGLKIWGLFISARRFPP